MLKLLFYNHTGKVSGAEQMLLLALDRLNLRGYETVLLCPAEGTLRRAAEKVGTKCGTAEPLNARFTWHPDQLVTYLCSLWRTVIDLRASIRRIAPDIIHANSTRAGIVATLSTTGMKIPVLWHVHDMLPRHPISTGIRFLALLSRRIHTVSCSQAAADAFQGKLLKWFGRRVSVLHNGIELSGFHFDPKLRDKLRSEWALKDGDFAIGIVGQVTARKGHLGLVRAFAAISPQAPNAHLFIIGAPLFNRDHECLEVALATAAAKGIADRVHYTGWRGDVAVVMSSLDLLTLNSSAEPLGLVILEAMVMGTPVLATASGGPGEILVHRETGHLVPPGNESLLADALLEVTRDGSLRKRYSDRGPNEVRNRFSADVYIQRLVEIYSSLLPPVAEEDLVNTPPDSKTLCMENVKRD